MFDPDSLAFLPPPARPATRVLVLPGTILAPNSITGAPSPALRGGRAASVNACAHLLLEGIQAAGQEAGTAAAVGGPHLLWRSSNASAVHVDADSGCALALASTLGACEEEGESWPAVTLEAASTAVVGAGEGHLPLTPLQATVSTSPKLCVGVAELEELNLELKSQPGLTTHGAATAAHVSSPPAASRQVPLLPLWLTTTPPLGVTQDGLDSGAFIGTTSLSSSSPSSWSWWAPARFACTLSDERALRHVHTSDALAWAVAGQPPAHILVVAIGSGAATPGAAAGVWEGVEPVSAPAAQRLNTTAFLSFAAAPHSIADRVNIAMHHAVSRVASAPSGTARSAAVIEGLSAPGALDTLIAALEALEVQALQAGAVGCVAVSISDWALVPSLPPSTPAEAEPLPPPFRVVLEMATPSGGSAPVAVRRVASAHHPTLPSEKHTSAPVLSLSLHPLLDVLPLLAARQGHGKESWTVQVGHLAASLDLHVPAGGEEGEETPLFIGILAQQPSPWTPLSAHELQTPVSAACEVSQSLGLSCHAATLQEVWEAALEAAVCGTGATMTHSKNTSTGYVLESLNRAFPAAPATSALPVLSLLQALCPSMATEATARASHYSCPGERPAAANFSQVLATINGGSGGAGQLPHYHYLSCPAAIAVVEPATAALPHKQHPQPPLPHSNTTTTGAGTLTFTVVSRPRGVPAHQPSPWTTSSRAYAARAPVTAGETRPRSLWATAKAVLRRGHLLGEAWDVALGTLALVIIVALATRAGQLWLLPRPRENGLMPARPLPSHLEEPQRTGLASAEGTGSEGEAQRPAGSVKQQSHEHRHHPRRGHRRGDGGSAPASPAEQPGVAGHNRPGGQPTQQQ